MSGIGIIFTSFMKNAAISILMICYLAVSTGVVVNFHYCMNKLASAELFAKESKKCGKCGMNIHKSKGCCRDEVKLLKMDDDQKNTAALSFQLHAPDALYNLPSEFISIPFINSLDGQRHYQNHSPPLLSGQDSYLQNRVFRI
jgi:hypothetical protein